MSAKPRGQKRGSTPKIRRGAGQISQEQADWVREEMRKRKAANPKMSSVSPSPVYGHVPAAQAPAAAQPATAGAPDQQVPLSNLWRAAIIIALAILAFIFLFNVLPMIIPDVGTSSGGGGGGGGGSGCQTVCDAYSVTVAPGCPAPAGGTYYNTISNPPSMAGYKQYIC